MTRLWIKAVKPSSNVNQTGRGFTFYLFAGYFEKRVGITSPHIYPIFYVSIMMCRQKVSTKLSTCWWAWYSRVARAAEGVSWVGTDAIRTIERSVRIQAFYSFSRLSTSYDWVMCLPTSRYEYIRNHTNGLNCVTGWMIIMISVSFHSTSGVWWELKGKYLIMLFHLFLEPRTNDFDPNARTQESFNTKTSTNL